MNNTDYEKIKWQPKEVIELGDGCRIGITTHEDSYTIFVLDHDGSWKPTNWIPARAARRLGELATSQLLLANELS
jgi:hypothetical protein